MKQATIYARVLLIGLFCLASLSRCRYDDRALSSRIQDLDDRVDHVEKRLTELEKLAAMFNADIKELKKLIASVNTGDYITSITPINEDGRQGYRIQFSKNKPIDIFHGVQGFTPKLGVIQEGQTYYWAINGAFMLDSNRNKIPVRGEPGKQGETGKAGTDGVTPEFKIEQNYWYVSYDGGKSWKKLGLAKDDTSSPSPNPSSGLFTDLKEEVDYVYLTIKGGTVLKIPKGDGLKLTLGRVGAIRMQPNTKYEISYTIGGGDDSTQIEVMAQDGYKASIRKDSREQGIIEVTTPHSLIDSRVLVFVSNGRGYTIMQAIVFSRGVMTIHQHVHTVGYQGGEIAIDLDTDLVYQVDIPQEAKSWLTFKSSGLRSTIRQERIIIEAARHEGKSNRYATVVLRSEDGEALQQISIVQQPNPSLAPEDGTTIILGDIKLVYMTDEKGYWISSWDNPPAVLDLEHLPALKGYDIIGWEEDVFHGQTHFTSIRIPQGVRRVVGFTHCPKLTHVSIPSSVEAIGKDAFSFCPNLTNIEFHEPCQLREIERGAFRGSGMRKFVIPQGVTELGEYSFADCYKLTRVDFAHPSALTQIGADAFYGCRNIDRIELPSSLAEIGSRAFAGATALSEIIFPQSGKLTQIEEEAFSRLPRLAAVKLPDGLEELAGFDQCSGLRSIDIPRSVHTLSGFNKCTSLFDIKFAENGSLTDLSGFDGCTSLMDINIPNTVTDLSGFAQCTELKAINIPESVTTLGGFDACTALKKIRFLGKSRVKAIRGFEGCTALKQVDIPASVIEIDGFDKCSALNQVRFAPESRLSDLYGFALCTSLRSIDIPSSVNHLGGFSGCTGLTNIIVPANTKEVAGNAFEKCSNITSIRFLSETPLETEPLFLKLLPSGA
ncbi:MAG: leucine-rich repeat protein, partial [Porphyromonadaceae bacterium]|nr:leucine-rich repeat protein [Porphyromonadaceae bacterium]